MKSLLVTTHFGNTFPLKDVERLKKAIESELSQYGWSHLYCESSEVTLSRQREKKNVCYVLAQNVEGETITSWYFDDVDAALRRFVGLCKKPSRPFLFAIHDRENWHEFYLSR